MSVKHHIDCKIAGLNANIVQLQEAMKEGKPVPRWVKRGVLETIPRLINETKRLKHIKETVS